MQESLSLRTLRSGAYCNILGAAAVLKFFQGPPPFGCASPDPAMLLATIALPNPAFLLSGADAVQIGTWETGSVGSGYAGCYRFNDAGGNCHIQGYVSEPWAPNAYYGIGRQVSTAAGVYRCILAGQSLAGGDGPSVTDSTIQIRDGSCKWSFLTGQLEMVLPSTAFMAGQTLTISGFKITAGNQ